MTEIQTPSIAELTQKAEAGDAQAQFELAYELSKSKNIDDDFLPLIKNIIERTMSKTSSWV